MVDSRIDFLPCFMACETNVPGYALGGPLVVAMCALRLHRSVRESFPKNVVSNDVLSETTERGHLSSASCFFAGGKAGDAFVPAL